ncbi:hypothetical protein [Halopseudomonas salina]|uniref:Lipoprotein n=1 Tax=Halopseudomonas salina TaxID=1323744 RepID=A0ABQ1Q0G3_9GAMM|nr:hypothetical protein [Halopseudomonas salina]GGD07867.1 hypothetical protein GCM10007418_28660 [Halopseudomonas salina]
MHMRTLLAGSLLALSGCSQAGSTDLVGEVGIYLDSGSTQCRDDGMKLEEMQQLLGDADIPFSAATCGTDGNMYTAMCGSPDGRIGIFQIAPEHLQLARALGFEALANVPDASPVDCSRW